MNTKLLLLPTLGLLGLFAACKPERTTSTAAAAPLSPLDPIAQAVATKPPAVDPTAEFKAALKDATYEGRDALPPARERLDQRIEAEIAGLKSAGQTIPLEKEKKLADARTELTKELDLLVASGAETWPTARDRVLAVLQNVRTAYAEAKSARSSS